MSKQHLTAYLWPRAGNPHWRLAIGTSCVSLLPHSESTVTKRSVPASDAIILKITTAAHVLIIIQLYFRPQGVHRKDNTKNAEHVNITQITKYALNMSAYRSAVRLNKVAIHMLFIFDATCTSLLITLCVIKLKETSSLQRRLYIDRLILAWQLSTLEDANMALALHLIGKLRRIRNKFIYVPLPRHIWTNRHLMAIN